MRPPTVPDLLLGTTSLTHEERSISLADDILPGVRPDFLNLGDLMGRGWSLIPLKPKSKLPAVRWQDYQHRMATVDELEQWFTTPGYNVGIVTGLLSKLMVIDADTLEAVEWAQANLPPTDLRVRTALWCRSKETKNEILF
jgi:hypothetical protein